MTQLVLPKGTAARLQKYLEEAEAKKKAESANKGSLEANLVAMGECETPEQQKNLIFAMLGADYLERLEPTGNRVLVITYVWPQKSKGGIHFIDKRRDANRYEGKTGLVIAIGPTAFRYDGSYKWEGRAPVIGDWIWYRASDAPERGYLNIYGRTIDDELIEGIARKDPRDVW
jgi:co-chaperonin GroES (HSP10)